jgi:hypothetical protein
LAAIEECDFGDLKDEVRATLHQFQSNKRAKKSSDDKERAEDDGGDKDGENGDDKDESDAKEADEDTQV